MINIFKIFGTSSGRGTSSVSGTSSMMGTSSEVGASSGRGTSSGIDVSSVSGTSQELDPSWQERSVINNSTVLAASGNDMEQKSFTNSFVAYDLLSDPVLTPVTSYESLVNECYKKNIIVYRCVTLIAESVASIRITATEHNTEFEKHPILDLLQRPNPNNSRKTFIESIVSYLLLSGNAYIKPVYAKGDNIPTEVYALRPDKVAVTRYPNGHIKNYVYSVNNKRQIFGNDEVIHLKLFNPFDEVYGLSPLCAAIKSVDQHNSISNHNIAILQNGGRPSGCLMVKNRTAPLSLKQRQFLESQIKDTYSGTKNSGKVLLLEGDFEWKEMGLSPKDMDFEAAKKMAAREIAEAYSVPPILVGINDDATFTNYREARFHFWEDTVIPYIDYILDELNVYIAEKFHTDLRLSYDKDKIDALIPRRDAIWNSVTNSDFLTINEKRQALGYPPIEGGDKLS